METLIYYIIFFILIILAVRFLLAILPFLIIGFIVFRIYMYFTKDSSSNDDDDASIPSSTSYSRSNNVIDGDYTEEEIKEDKE